MPVPADWISLGRVPEQAIRAFERAHRLNVAVHDLTGLLQRHLDPSHTYHRHPFCEATKTGGIARCYDWEVADLRPQLRLLPEGRAQVCHMGLLEWVVPVLIQDEVAAVLFAGPRVASRSLVSLTIHPDAPRTAPRGFRSTSVDDSDSILESLRQLASRLRQWLIDLREQLGNVHHDGADSARRDARIRAFVRERHTQPVTQRDLAEVLGISPSRCAHVVREATGQTFRQLLYDARIRTACWLLAQTDLPLKQIVSRIAINDLSYFHRLFRARTGLAPARYRKRHRT